MWGRIAQTERVIPEIDKFASLYAKQDKENNAIAQNAETALCANLCPNGYGNPYIYYTFKFIRHLSCVANIKPLFCCCMSSIALQEMYSVPKEDLSSVAT